jgi:Uma2 family endonuclease
MPSDDPNSGDSQPDRRSPPDGPLSEEEFIAWRGAEARAEWVDGRVILMSPGNYAHVDLQIWLGGVLRFFVEFRQLGTVLGPEFQIRLAQQRRRRIPDLLYVSMAHQDRLRPTHLEGVPDLVIEIVSPDSEARDWREKYFEYESAGVQEYWIIDPASQHAELYILAGDGHYHQADERDGWLASAALPGLRLKIDWFWPATRPAGMEALRELGVRFLGSAGKR